MWWNNNSKQLYYIMLSENIGFFEETNIIHSYFSITIMQNFSFIYALKPLTYKTMDLHTLVKTIVFLENIGFSRFYKLYKHFQNNHAYELTNIPYVDVFQNNLYSQVTGKLRSSTKYVKVLCIWKLSNNLWYEYVIFRHCTWCEQCQL